MSNPNNNPALRANLLGGEEIDNRMQHNRLSNKLTICLKITSIVIFLSGFVYFSFYYFKSENKNLIDPNTEFLSSSMVDFKFSRAKTLKMAYEMSFFALLADTEGHKKFEASDIVLANNQLYVVSDNLWSIVKSGLDLHAFSKNNYLINPSQEDALTVQSNITDSQWETIFYNSMNGTYIVGAECSKDQGKYYESEFFELKVYKNTYNIVEKCSCDKKFKFSNKGFEGLVGFYTPSNELYLLALCEGNYCSGSDKGKEPGNGRMVLLKKHYTDNECMWKTIKEIELPKKAYFEDYSAATVIGNKLTVVSQATSAIWVGEVELNDDNTIDPEKFEIINEGEVYNFPRDASGEVQYCNVEGITYINERMFVAVSDKMKKYQPPNCLEKDQSIHVFVLP